MKPKVTIIGLGYVGMPLAKAIAASGKYEVYGLIRRIHPDREKVNSLNVTTNPANCLPQSDFIIICVPTPAYKNHTPDLRAVISVTKTIARFLRRNQTIILESTVAPGTCEKILLPILEKTGLKGGVDFELSHCPERINPADPKWTVLNIPRNVGSLTQKGLIKTAAFYKSFLTASINPMRNLTETEATKMVENTFRDLNIAFVNELAIIFDAMGIDTKNVLTAAGNKPFGYLSHWPGCGVGGECIPVDPYYLITAAQHHGINPILIKTARKINNTMPIYTVKLLLTALKKYKLPAHKTRIGILGISYKPDVADTRESPGLEIIKLLRKKNIPLVIYDPYNKQHSTVHNLSQLLEKVSVLVICTAHQSFVTDLTASFLKKNKIKIIIDGRNCLPSEEIKQSGIYYKGIGR